MGGDALKVIGICCVSCLVQSCISASAQAGCKKNDTCNGVFMCINCIICLIAMVFMGMELSKS